MLQGKAEPEATCSGKRKWAGGGATLGSAPRLPPQLPDPQCLRPETPELPCRVRIITPDGEAGSTEAPRGSCLSKGT